jgi:MFS family permease
MGRYLEILRTPNMARLFATAVLARLPIGINGLAVVLLLKAETGSFGAAGAAAGALALGSGVGAPLTGRLVDGFGTRMLVGLAAASATALLGLVALARVDAPASALVAAAFASGLSFPPTGAVLRAQYPRLFGEQPALLQTAFALDSVMIELVFTVAPLLVAALVVLFEPAVALVVSAGALVVGTIALVATLPGDDERAVDAARAARSRLGALAVPGIRTLVASTLPVGFAFGALEVALPAFADQEGEPELAGVLIALWGFGSAAGGLAYGARARRGSLTCAHLRVAALLPVSFLPMALATSPATMALLVVPAGILISPLIATRNELVGRVAPAGAGTEAYTWPLTALVGGIAFGAAASGAIADSLTWQTAVLVAAASAGVGAVLAAARRATLAPAT